MMSLEECGRPILEKLYNGDLYFARGLRVFLDILL